MLLSQASSLLTMKQQDIAHIHSSLLNLSNHYREVTINQTSLIIIKR